MSDEEEIIRVLLADDDPKTLNFLAEVLFKQGGFSVDAAENGMEALDLLKRNNYRCDLLVTGLEMSGFSGEELLDRLFVLRPKQGVVVVTARDSDASATRCLKKGVIDYIRKPVSADRFVDAVAAAAKQAREQAAAAAGMLDVETPLVGWMETTTPNDIGYLERFNHFLSQLRSLPFNAAERRGMQSVIADIGQKIKTLGKDGGCALKMSYTVFSEQLTVVIEDPNVDFCSDWKNAMRLGDQAAPELREQIRRFFKVMDEVLFSEDGTIVLMSKRFAPTPS